VCRIGEAANPGPNANDAFTIGCINPTGLLGRGSLIAELPKARESTTWAVSETHLSASGKAMFQKELAYHKAGYHLQTGAMTPTRSNTISSIAGKHRGVAFLSTSPCRTMSTTWPRSDWDDARFHVSCFQVGQRWVQGGVIYGYAAQPETTATKTKTEELCQHVIKRLLQHSQGLRFIAGDLNQPDDALPSMQQLKEAGWVNVQQWAMEKLNKPIQVTCKNKSTKDHIYVSPELAMYLKDCEVQHDWFPDHSVIIAKFHSLGKPPKIPIWRQPKSIPWKEIDPAAIAKQYQPPEKQANLTEAYRLVCHSVEAAAKRTLQAKQQHLPDCSQGRAATLEVRWRQEHSSPPKVAREGEYQPEYHGLNLQHARWMRQYRRMLNFARMDPNKPGHAYVHRQQLWQSIQSAAGFSPNFPRWWGDTNPDQTMPNEPPGPEEATRLCNSFHKSLTAFEKALNQQRTASAKQRRTEDPMLIFRDLKQPPPQPVQMLLNQPAATVTRVEDDSSIVVHPEQQWDPAVPLQTPEGIKTIIHAEPDQIWIDDTENLQPGSKISQEKYVGELTALFAQFGQEWTKRWDRHLQIDPSRWDPIIAFAETVLPKPPPMEYHAITVEEWDCALRHKSKKAATGPDGVSRQDLLEWPLEAKQALLGIFHSIENGQPWPKQMITGFVVALEKTPNAATVNQYRPITVFSLCYRVWSSIRAKQILKHLQPYAPTTCTGNLPGRHAAQVWYGVMQEIELAQMNKGSLTGWVVDLIKAFNMLPRTPILHFMSILNVNPKVMHAWGMALVSMERRFKLHNCVGPSLLSSTGFPEGCALSVTAMLAHNLVGHSFVKLRYPSVTLWSFVDNIEATAPAAEEAITALEGFQQFSEVMDVLIDNDKSYFWSVDASQRKTLRASEQVVKLQARDLGGHVQYSQVVTNATITGRCQEIKPLWGRLARSLAPYVQKVRALVAKAWPSCLHGIASVHMADDHFDKLRTGALQGLGEHSSGTSPHIHLSLIEGATTDPQYHALLTTVLMYREQNHGEDVTEFCMSELHRVGRTYVPRPGPMSVLLSRLHQIAWSWSDGAMFLDHLRRPIALLTCPIQEIRARLADAWQNRIKNIAAQRKTFRGMQWSSPVLSTCGMQHHSAEDKALLRVCMNGTFFTADRRKHQHQEHDTTCSHCHEQDSLVHRHWTCPAFADQRTVNTEQAKDIADMAPSIAAHGWMPEPPNLPAFQHLLLSLPDDTKQFIWPAQVPDEIYAFTDGGCLAPTCKVSKLATWGVVIANRDMTTFWPVANGLVTGWVQTALRGEITAAICACAFAIQCNRPLRLWTDNDLVYKRIQRFRERSCFFKPNQKDADLWKQLHELVRQLGPSLCQVTKVCSHQDLAGAADEYEAWVIAGNQAADRLTEAAVHRFPTVYELWQSLQRDVAHIHLFRNHVHRTLIQVGRKAVMTNASKPTDKQHKERIPKEALAETDFSPLTVEDLPSKYNFDQAGTLLAWLGNLTDPAEPLRSVSWFQINALYEYQTGCKGVRHQTKKKSGLTVSMMSNTLIF
jgi:hypothetical protein